MAKDLVKSNQFKENQINFIRNRIQYRSKQVTGCHDNVNPLIIRLYRQIKRF